MVFAGIRVVEADFVPLVLIWELLVGMAGDISGILAN